MELAVRCLYKKRRYATINSFLRDMSDKHVLLSDFDKAKGRVVLTVPTVSMMFESLINERNYGLIDILWNNVYYGDRRRWRIIGLYVRALLGSSRIDEASEYLHTLKSNPKKYSVATAPVLQGLFEGHYYEECLAFYNFLAQQEKVYINDPRGFFAALLAAYHLKDYSAVLSIFGLVKERDYWLSRSVVYAVTEIYMKGDFWREKYTNEMQALQQQGEIDVNRQLEVLAKSRLPQFISGARVMGDFCNRNNECVIKLDAQKNLSLKLSTYEETQRRMRILSAFIEVIQKYQSSDFDRRFLVVKTIKNDTVIPKLLQQELSPSIYCIVRVRQELSVVM